MTRWLDMARAVEKPPVPFANNAKNLKKHEKSGTEGNIGNSGNWQSGLHGESSRPAEWSGNDFRVFYEECAAILEYDGELDRPEAERQAFEATVIHWMNLTPPPSLSEDHCSQCGDPVGEAGNDAVPFISGDGGHAWLHHECHSAWMTQRRREAIENLGAMGITP